MPQPAEERSYGGQTPETRTSEWVAQPHSLFAIERVKCTTFGPDASHGGPLDYVRQSAREAGEPQAQSAAKFSRRKS